MSFGKKSGCPSSESVLAYAGKSLSPLRARRVAQHIAKCDFCGVEMIFLAKHAPRNEGKPPSSRPRQKDLVEKMLISTTVYNGHESRAA